MFTKYFERDGSMASTLDPDEVCENHGSLTGFSTRVHPDGWTISGHITEDYYYWVNSFEAHHPIFGRVWGDFEDVVHADSEDAYRFFYDAHGPTSWDYQDI